jgi:hypothetical protein
MSRKRKRRGSIVYQAKEALRAIFLHDDQVTEVRLKQAGFPGRGIGTISTMQTYTRKACNFARWCQERYGVRDTRQITAEMAIEYLHTLRDQEYPQSTIAVAVAALRKLDVGMRVRGDWAQDAPALLAWSGEEGS